MSESGSARPRQLTMAGWFVVVASVLLVITVYSTIAGLNSVDTRDRVSEWLSTPTGAGLGLSVTGALSGLRAALMVTGLCAAASAVLGFFVLQRHRGARLALTIVAVPILLANLVTAPLTGGLLGALIAASTMVLWTGPGRDWFAGRPVRQPTVPLRRSERTADDTPPSTPPSTPPHQPSAGPSGTASPPPVDLSSQPSARPPATYGYGQRPAHQEPGLPPDQWAPPTGPPIGSPTSWGRPQESSGPPPMVKAACALTWAFSGIVALVYVVMLFVLVVARSEIVDYVTGLPEWQQSNLRPGALIPILWLGSLMFLAWAVGSMVLAWFTWRRHNWARYLLVASAGGALLAGLFAIPFSLVHLTACVVVIVGLFTARSRAWFAAPARGGWPPQAPPPGPPPGPPAVPPPSSSHPASPPPDRSGRPPVW